MPDFELDLERLELLQLCWPEAGDQEGKDALEGCIHEMAHVLDATGDVVHHGGEVVGALNGLHFLRRDYNEIRASAVTRLVMMGLGFLSWGLEKMIFESMEANTEWLNNEAVRHFWWRMKSSQKTQRMALKIIDVLITWEVIRVDPGEGQGADDGV